jgi:hypothetical protein
MSGANRCSEIRRMPTSKNLQLIRRLIWAVMLLMVLDVVFGFWWLGPGRHGSEQWPRWLILGPALIGLVTVGFLKGQLR